MRNRHHTALAEAYSRDADRAGPDASADLPRYLLLEFLTLLIRCMLRQCLGSRFPRARPLPSWWVTLPDCVPGSTQELAASIRGPIGHAMAHMCRYLGFGPGHQDWPYLSRSILAFGGSLKGVDGRKHPRPCLETHWIVPAVIGADAAATPTAAALLARRLAANAPPPAPPPVAAGAGPAVLPAPLRPVLARTATGPPTGPPPAGAVPSGLTDARMSDARGRSTASPAILIRVVAPWPKPAARRPTRWGDLPPRGRNPEQCRDRRLTRTPIVSQETKRDARGTRRVGGRSPRFGSTPHHVSVVRLTPAPIVSQQTM